MARNLRVGVQRGLRQSIGGGLGTGDIFTLSPASFDFSRTNTKDSRITFTRASSGTFVGADGLIKTTPVNFMPRSEQLDQWNKYFGASVTADSTAAPNGTLTADKIDLSAGGIAQVTRNVSGLTPSATYTVSFYAKSVTGTGTIFLYRPIPGFTFTVTTEWQRFTATVTQSASSTNGSVNFLYSGSGLTEFFVWGVQYEEGSVATDYIPTTGISGAPRFDHDPVTGKSLGLLVEESRSNLLTYSEEFDDSSWEKFGSFISSQVVNAATSPDGNNTAEQYTNSVSGTNNLQKKVTVTAEVYTFSIYLKAATANDVGKYLTIGAHTSGSTHNRVLVQLPAEWTRFTASGTCTAAVWNFGVDGRTDGTFTGLNQTREESTFFAWGTQLELGSFQTSYIPTSGSTVTRAADVVEITGTNFSSFYNQSEGTMFAKFNINGFGFFSRVYEYQEGTSSAETHHLFVSSDGSNETPALKARTKNGGDTQVNLVSANVSAGTPLKTAYGYKVNNFGFTLNGATPSLDTNGSIPTDIDRLTIGNREDGLRPFTGHIKRIAYFPTRLPDATLQSITS